MPDDPKTLTWYSKTNKRENSCTPVTCGCPLWFELHQQTAIKLLSNHTKNNKYKLEPGYEARAKRIAAIYAHLFLETLVLDDKAHPKQPIKFGNTNLRGGFYWMGLGAFASKTMAMVFGAWRTTGAYAFNWIAEFYSILTTTEKAHVQHSINTLAKGNLWLAMDIIPWHLAWDNDKVGFKKCIDSRNLAEFKNLKPAIDSSPWSGSVPNMINQLRYTPEIYGAFIFGLKKIEKEFTSPKNNTEQKRFIAAKDDLLYHLKQIAVQEQKNILQKICWDDPQIVNNLEMQRDIQAIPILKEILIDTTLILSSDYDLGDAKDKRKDKKEPEYSLPDDHWSSPPDNLKVEKYGDYNNPDNSPPDSRMHWILKGAVPKYHLLMMRDVGRKYLINELKEISKWLLERADPLDQISKHSNEGKR